MKSKCSFIGLTSLWPIVLFVSSCVSRYMSHCVPLSQIPCVCLSLEVLFLLLFPPPPPLPLPFPFPLPPPPTLPLPVLVLVLPTSSYFFLFLLLPPPLFLFLLLFFFFFIFLFFFFLLRYDILDRSQLSRCSPANRASLARQRDSRAVSNLFTIDRDPLLCS